MDTDTIFYVKNGIGYAVNIGAIVRDIAESEDRINAEIEGATTAANNLADMLGYSEDDRKDIVEYVCGKAKELNANRESVYSEVASCIGNVGCEDGVYKTLDPTSDDQCAESTENQDVELTNCAEAITTQEFTPYNIER